MKLRVVAIILLLSLLLFFGFKKVSPNKNKEQSTNIEQLNILKYLPENNKLLFISIFKGISIYGYRFNRQETAGLAAGGRQHQHLGIGGQVAYFTVSLLATHQPAGGTGDHSEAGRGVGSRSAWHECCCVCDREPDPNWPTKSDRV